jgi:hypothetical protein
LLLAAGCWNGVGSFSDDAGGGAGGSSGSVACNSLQPGSTFVHPGDSGMNQPPPATGGTIVDGPYHLATTTYYPKLSCGGSIGLATALVVAAASDTSGQFQLVTGGEGVTGAVGETMSYAMRGASLAVRIECITNDPGGLRGSLTEVPFNATPSQLQLYLTFGSCGLRVDTYQKD